MSTEKMREELSALIAECERANKTALDDIGMGLIDMNAIERARAALASAQQGEPCALCEGGPARLRCADGLYFKECATCGSEYTGAAEAKLNRAAKMQQREPVAWEYTNNGSGDVVIDTSPPADDDLKYSTVRPLVYGATQAHQGEPVAVPAGWKLVPVEPTRDMIYAATRAESRHMVEESKRGGVDCQLGWSAAYRAMLGSAPEVPEEAEPVGLREAAMKVVSMIEGDLPVCGWLKDNGASRAALGELRAALAAAPEAPEERKPLTGEEIYDGYYGKESRGLIEAYFAGVRFAEAAHGIKP